MVGTVQASRTGGGRLGKLVIKFKEIEKGTHKSLLYQHNTKPLLHAVWADNNFVKTLSNFHSPTIVQDGMKRRVRDPVTKERAREQTDVDCNAQQIDYCKTYHKIDKGNGAEAKYDLSTESHLHGWGPKLAAQVIQCDSGIQDITTSTTCTDGRSVRSDSIQQPISSPIAHGTGGTHARTPQSSISDV
ncbi:hypothetical protein FRACYDRAFT_252696 [Fragilariopsis cylindrus CCMP1102]|uniref:PiggyBac transposable element-derived protein domain-containing protein n=1 Tax=Fragilariopsis cylindrus CCMP1102 TaxID=635003 RepID=A0A1E7EMP7_9STRA|nr:hypothetical protein FRACYDRAFT_252696 [Fragilariopsis cylindrus CCMP1102]|eukprot:OEU06853.1 hypothetical protein FRACYDRAFT_252696 [Fragilariopsis cylindrus CCMP1102]